MRPCLAARQICTGCGACVASCTFHAIKMQEDTDGFRRPVIEMSACRECGRCEMSCPVKKPLPNAGAPHALAAYAKDIDVRLRSSSGGIFPLLAANILRKHGLVFGAVIASDGSVKHIECSRIEDLPTLCGSKYAQSSLDGVYELVKKRLSENTTVLFCGTPCQVAGLNRIVGGSDKLLTVDLICHGVPSGALLRTYLSQLEKRYCDKIERITFRNKPHVWQKSYLRISFFGETDDIFEPLYQNAYGRAFGECYSLRESCFDCFAKAGRSGADITLGDFWGIEQVDKQMDDGHGVSAVLVHSHAGQRLLDAIGEEVVMKGVSFADVLSKNPSYLYSSDKPPAYKYFKKHCLSNLSLDKTLSIAEHGGPLKHWVKLLLGFVK